MNKKKKTGKWTALRLSEQEKLKDLSGRQKLQYILDYYWLWILGIGAALFLVIYIVYRAGFTVKDYWFYGVFANTMENGGNGSPLWEDYVSYTGYNTRQKRVEMNASSYFDPSVPGGTNNSYYQSFVALVESGDLDVVVLGKEGLKAIGSSGRLLDLRDEKCGSLMTDYADRIVFCVPYDEEYSEEPVPVGIDISDSLLVSRYHLYPDDCVLGISACTKRPESAAEFLEFVLQDAPETGSLTGSSETEIREE